MLRSARLTHWGTTHLLIGRTAYLGLVCVTYAISDKGAQREAHEGSRSNLIT